MKKIILLSFLLLDIITVTRAQDIPDEYFKASKTKKIAKAGSYDEKGDIYFDQGEYQKAIEEYTKAIVDIYNYEKEVSYCNKGDAYRRLKEYDKAILSYKQAISTKEDYAWAYRQLGLTYYLTSDYKKGVETIENAIDLGASHGWITQILGICCYHTLEFEKSSDYIQEAIFRGAEILDFTYYYYYGLSFYCQKRYTSAIKFLERYINKVDGKLYQETFNTYNVLGLSYIRENKRNKAIKCFNKTIELFTEKSIYTIYAYFHRGDRAKAINLLSELIDEAISKGANAVYGYYCMANLQSLNSNEQEALNYFELALKNGMKNFEWIAFDPDLDNIRNLPEFKKLVEKYKR